MAGMQASVTYHLRWRSAGCGHRPSPHDVPRLGRLPVTQQHLHLAGGSSWHEHALEACVLPLTQARDSPHHSGSVKPWWLDQAHSIGP